MANSLKTITAELFRFPIMCNTSQNPAAIFPTSSLFIHYKAVLIELPPQNCGFRFSPAQRWLHASVCPLRVWRSDELCPFFIHGHAAGSFQRTSACFKVIFSALTSTSGAI